MVKYLIIVVLYNKAPREASTLVSLSNMQVDMCKNMRVVLWNNSPSDYDATSKVELHNMLKEFKVDYIYNGGENLPLSVIYNRSIREFLDDDEMLVIMDDDSVFDEQLFRCASVNIAQNPAVDLFLPIVYNGNEIVSPAYMNGFKGHYLKHVSPGLMSTRHTTAINSGMIIRASYLRHGFEGYDERIKFYFTDNDFMSRYDASHKELFVLDYKMRHTLDFYKKGESYERKKRRFRDLRRAFLILMRRQGFITYLLTQAYLFVYSVKFAIIQKDIRYIFVF